MIQLIVLLTIEPSFPITYEKCLPGAMPAGADPLLRLFLHALSV